MAFAEHRCQLVQCIAEIRIRLFVISGELAQNGETIQSASSRQGCVFPTQSGRIGYVECVLESLFGFVITLLKK